MDKFNIRFLRFCKPFVEAIKGLYTNTFGIDILPQPAHFGKHQQKFVGFGSNIKFNGTFLEEKKTFNFQGEIALTWSKEVYLEFAKILLQEDFNEINEEISEIGTEIIKIVMGNSIQTLREQGYILEILNSNSITRQDPKFDFDEKLTTILTNLKSEVGDTVFFLSYGELKQV